MNLTKLRQTLLVNNIANHFAHGTPLRPWVKEWVQSWDYISHDCWHLSNYVVPWMFATGRGHLNILGTYNYWWKIQSKHFIPDYENLINDWIESANIVDRINKVLKIKSYYVHFRVEDKEWSGKIRYRKYTLTLFGQNIADAMRQIKLNFCNAKNRVLKIQRIREGNPIGKLMVEEKWIEIPHMKDKLFQKTC